jgi:DMSO/TMAO reductase YedYZ molybdopterin-dependent catalytic subunit
LSLRRKSFLTGVGATALALFAIFLGNKFLRAVPYPPATFASLIVKAMPGDFATAMIERLGHNAMRGLNAGIHLAVLALGGALAVYLRAPLDARTGARRAVAAVVLLWLACVGLAIGSAQGMSLIAPVVYFAGIFPAVRISLGTRLGRAFEPPIRGEETPLDAIRTSRRNFIRRGLAAVAGLVIGGTLLIRFLTSKSPLEINIANADVPFDPPPDDAAFPDVPGISPEITKNDDFYTVDINIVKPSVDHETWSLKVHGLVDEPYTLTYSKLQSDFEVVETAHTLTCISNEVGGDLISTAIWRGVRLKDVLDRAGLKDGVIDVVFRAAEGYSDSISLAKAIEATTLVVFGMNGTALPREHGFPARIIVPGIYGMKNVKWLTEIEPVNRDYKGYWMVRGWSDIAKVKTESRIDTPHERAKLPAKVAGVAWAGNRLISRVEVSDDGGASWRPALLKRALSPLTWRLWAIELEPGKGGRRKVLVRAVDGTGTTQTPLKTAPHPDGASGYHKVELTVS